jgi:uncharacterized membrane protein
MNLSKNGLALTVLIAEALLSALGIEFEPGTVAKGVEGFVIVLALLSAIYNQLKREDVKAFILKK